MSDENTKDGITKEEAIDNTKTISENETPEITNNEIHNETEEKINTEEKKESEEERKEEKPEKERKKLNLKSFSWLGIIFLAFVAFAFVYTYTINKGNVAQNTLIIQNEISDTNNLLELYTVTNDDRYIILAYGKIKGMDELLRQTLLNRESIDFFTVSDSYYQFLWYLGEKSSYFEDVIKGRKELTKYDIKEMKLILKTIEEEVLPTTSIDDFMQETDIIIENLYMQY
ncbi:hypothetical protein [Bacillus cereus group sp. TH152-1LC]|uniref:hypothetical protein n=1 Tax=Bacillus cereus group sp. TH152-1LC TaxID=3018060 RepID=UPI0022E6EF73|nr:hypothetical protein [Bacillus cereus group sp. TH152-1LC]MDA1675700.1 hypothetical protein [Bacillus cereus group sp. TH152-1LC]